MCCFWAQFFLYGFSFLRSYNTKISILVTALVCIPRRISAWYYMKLLHLRRRASRFAEINYLRLNLDSSKNSQPLSFEIYIFFFQKSVCKILQKHLSCISKWWALTLDIFLKFWSTDSLGFFAKQILQEQLLWHKHQ